MKGKRFAPTQVIRILKEPEAGTEVTELIRKYGSAINTFYIWKGKYGGTENNQIQELKDLESDNSKLKKLLAERNLEIEALKDVYLKKVELRQKREAVGVLMAHGPNRHLQHIKCPPDH